MFPLQPWSYLLICITTTSVSPKGEVTESYTLFTCNTSWWIKASVVCKYFNILTLDSLLRETVVWCMNRQVTQVETDADSLQAGKQTSCFTGVVPGWGRGVESRAGGAEASLLVKELLTSTPNGQVYTSTLSLWEIIFTSLQMITWTHLVFTSNIK